MVGALPGGTKKQILHDEKKIILSYPPVTYCYLQ